MRCVYQPEAESFWFNHYMSGSGMSAFAGIPYQRGNGIGSIFRSLLRLIAPIAKKLAPGIAGEVMGMGGEIVRNMADGSDWKQPAKTRAKKAAGYVMEEVGKHMQAGSGLGKRPRAESIKRTTKRQKTNSLHGVLA